jgi:hypothetical protein
MKNLIPLMALLVLGGTFAPGALAGGKCTDGDSCCKDGAKQKCSKGSKAKGAAKETKGESKPAETK